MWRDTEYLSVVSPKAGKYGPEKPPYLGIFHAVKALVLTIPSTSIFPVLLLSIGVPKMCNKFTGEHFTEGAF